jgi:hypothetical protein
LLQHLLAVLLAASAESHDMTGHVDCLIAID